MASNSIRVVGTGRLGMALAGLFTAAIVGATPVHADGVRCSLDEVSRPRAELFATDNTAVINSRDDARLRDRLELFELQVDATVLANAAVVTGSMLVDGVFWVACDASDDIRAFPRFSPVLRGRIAATPDR